MALTVEVGADGVHVRFTGLDRALCLSSGVRLEPAEIVAARVVPVAEVKASLGWRVGGGYWPGRFATGWFTVRGTKGHRQLWDVYRDAEVLVIDATRTRPCRVVLQHPGRAPLAEAIGAVAGSGPATPG